MAVATGSQQAGAAATLATQLVAGDRILVALSIQDRNGKRSAVNYMFDETGEQVDQSGHRIGGPALALQHAANRGQEPQFDSASYVRLLRENKKAEADQISVAYKNAIDAFNGTNGGTTADRIGSAVYAFLRQHHNVRPTQHEGPTLREEEVNVRPPARAEATQPGVWLLMLTPVWGI